LRTAELILTDQSRHIVEVAAQLARVGDHNDFEQMLIPAAYVPESAFGMCELLVRLYPNQACAIADAVNTRLIMNRPAD